MEALVPTQDAAQAFLPTLSVVGRFWQYVERTDGEGCWEWQGRRDVRGYGRLWVGRRHLLAHRISYAIAWGGLPAGPHVLHHCDNPPCVRPDHLWLGSHADNIRDAARKGRLYRKGRPGVTNPLAKLDDQKVTDARARYSRGEFIKDLAKDYGVSRSTMAKAVHRQKWVHVP